MPKRSYRSVEEFKEHWAEEGEILMDATEQRRKRLVIKKIRKMTTEVKKARTLKFLILATPEKRIKYLSDACCGSTHDYAILKAELPLDGYLWFDQLNIHVDLGFLGIRKDYSTERISIPFKKSKNKKLTEEHKAINKQKSAFRVTVEHSIGGLKRCGFLSDRLRCRDIQLYNLVAGICAGLWNFA